MLKTKKMPCLSKCNFGAILLQNAKLVVKKPSELVHMSKISKTSSILCGLPKIFGKVYNKDQRPSNKIDLLTYV